MTTATGDPLWFIVAYVAAFFAAGIALLLMVCDLAARAGSWWAGRR